VVSDVLPPPPAPPRGPPPQRATPVTPATVEDGTTQDVGTWVEIFANHPLNLLKGFFC